jgi:hypothetical protein
MLPDTGIDDVIKQRNAEYVKHINDPVISSLKMEGIRLLFLILFLVCSTALTLLRLYMSCINTTGMAWKEFGKYLGWQS